MAVPTFKRTAPLLDLIQSIARQSLKPSLVLIVDNNPDGAARSVVDEARREEERLTIEYLPMGQNIGPAGAFAVAMDFLGSHSSKLQWMLCRGDDNPFTERNYIAELQSLAVTATTLNAVGFGFSGMRVGDRDLLRDRDARNVYVDYINGGYAPVYDVRACRAAGLNFNRHLFFGYEEMEFGLRTNARGMRLIASRVVPENTRTAPRMRSSDAWRIYFSRRNRVRIAREFHPASLPYIVARAIYVAARRQFLDGAPAVSAAIIRGVIDGLRAPTVAPPSEYIPS